MRRRALVAELRHDLELVELRGNVDTRLRKVADGEVAAAILAAAGMERLGEGSQAAPLSLGVWVPAPGQGALAVEVRRDRPELLELFGALEDPETRAELTCERAFARVVEGGCSVPLGCHAAVRGGHIAVTGFLGDPSTRTFLRRRASGPRAEAGATGERLARELMEAGGKEILASLSAREVPGVSAP
jgi:hydroxymethylbilane synthase